MSESADASDACLSEKDSLPFSLKELLSHTPDIIVQRNPQSPVPQTVAFYGVVLFADISGFTALCEKYCNDSDESSSGTDQLTTTLNSYLSKIVDDIIKADGDIVKFAGDALLAFWPCSKYEAVYTVQHVIRMCLNLQSALDKYRTVDGVVLRMKLGVSVGPMEMYHVGNTMYRMFDLAGEAVDDVNTAQNLARSGAVVISPAAWDTCNKPCCHANLLPNGYIQILKVTQEPLDEFVPASTVRDLLVKEQRQGSVLGLTRNAVSAKRKATLPDVMERPTSPALGSSRLIEPNPFSPLKPEKRGSVVGSSSYNSTSSLLGEVQSSKFTDAPVERSILQLHLKSITPETEPFLRSYIQKTVVDRVDHGHDASWMSELRKVCVLFVNLDPKEKLDKSGKLLMLQSSFDALHPVMMRYEGTINKVFMFDKGCTFVCIFGLPNAKHEDDSKRALKASKHIYHNLEELDLSHISIGVTTGTAFCGVVGHPLRHEYTVIGQKVNMAARLMMKFPNAITCDEMSKKSSNMSDQLFTLLPPPKLKGISQPEDVFAFSTDRVQSCSSHTHELHYSQEHDTLVGRHKEMAVMVEHFTAIKDGRERESGIIAITGSGGMGKTKLLKSAKSVAAEMEFRVVSTMGTIDEQNTPFHVVKTLLSRLLDIDKTKAMHDREQIILDQVATDEQRELLPLLNDLLVMKFPQTSTTSHLSHKERQEGLHKLLLSLIHQFAESTPCVFGIDNAQYMDEDSWPFIFDLARDNNTLVIITLRFGKMRKKPHSKGLEVMDHPMTKQMDLEGLSKEETIAFACQMLDANEIPDNLSQILHDKTHGIPLWCEELVSSMIERGLLSVSEGDEGSDEERDQVGELKPHSAVGGRLHEFLGHMNGKDSRRKSVVQFTRSVRPEDISVPDSVTGMILARVDHLSATSQMVLKCATVLGTAFSKEMLLAITPSKMKEDKFQRILSELASSGLIECYYSGRAQGVESDLEDRDTDLCPCLGRKRSRMSLCKNTVYVDECSMFQFVHPYVQDTVYQLWTKSQRKQLHKSAAQFLESQAHKCQNCGGGGFAALGLPTTTRRMTLDRGGARGRAFMGTSTRTAIQRNRRRSTGAWRRNTICPEEPEMPRAQSSRRQSLIDSLLGGEEGLDELPSSASVHFDLQDCHCDEVLSKVYPQLIRHWKEVGDLHKVWHYLSEAGAAAVTMFNNLEALSLLEEAKELSLKAHMEGELTTHESAELESLIGQALFQSGEVDECLPHFTKAVSMLGGKLPTGNFSSAVHFLKMATRQYFHRKFPQQFIGIKRGLASEKFLDQARCLAHVTHTYHLQHNNWKTLMAALHQLNTAEEAQENFHELIEAYSTMIECCQLFGYHSLARDYIQQGMKYCNKVEPDVNDLLSYAHFLNVVLNFSLSQGDISDAVKYGKAAISISNKLHEVPIKLASLTLLSQAFLANKEYDECAGILDQLSSVVEQADDLRAKALYEFYTFDAHLECGICEEAMEAVLTSAKHCSHEDVFHYDGEERFCLLAALALWYAEKSEWKAMNKYLCMARSVRPEQMETYLVSRGLQRLIQCELLWCESHRPNRETKKNIKCDMKLLKKLSKKLAAFKVVYKDFTKLKQTIDKSHK